jgi:hypothetical protein
VCDYEHFLLRACARMWRETDAMTEFRMVWTPRVNLLFVTPFQKRVSPSLEKRGER